MDTNVDGKYLELSQSLWLNTTTVTAASLQKLLQMLALQPELIGAAAAAIQEQGARKAPLDVQPTRNDAIASTSNTSPSSLRK